MQDEKMEKVEQLRDEGPEDRVGRPFTDKQSLAELVMSHPLPFRFLAMLAVSIFIAEMLIMVLLLFLPPLPPAAIVVLDGFLLIVLISPLLYFFSFRPLIRDVVKRKRAEEALDERASLNQLLLDALPCVALLLRPGNREIVASNKAARDAGAVPGKQCFATWAQRTDPCPWCLALEACSTGEPQHLQLDAEDIVWDAHWHPVGPDLYLHYAFDFTEKVRAEKEREKLQARLQHAEKMEAIGALAGGVAHDLNNILSGITGYPELLLLDLPEDSSLRNSLQIILDSGLKAAAIVEDMLTLAKSGISDADPVNLNDVVSDYLDSPVWEKVKTYHPGVQVQTDLGEDLLNILGSPIHLSKVVMNLVSNAAEAMPGGGEIVISTENRYVDRPVEGSDSIEEGDYVMLMVTDTGVGLSPEEMGKIFEPFYTKRALGRSGTGLGAAVVWRTVKDHSGYIDIHSEVGKGTTFTLYFPATRKELAKDESDVSIEELRGSGESILVVDDVKEQRGLASEMLTRLGYSVSAVSNGEDAVEHLKSNHADILILDMIMYPGIDGLETYKRICELRPGQKAIIVSGFSESDKVKEARALGAGAYVRKPYTMESIGTAVRNELKK